MTLVVPTPPPTADDAVALALALLGSPSRPAPPDLRPPGGAPTGGAEPGDTDELYGPPAIRDNPALGEEVNQALVRWAEQVGIYPGQRDKVRATNFGRLIMLTHPGTDDPDRLLAAAKCILAEWATDDHFLDDPSLGGDAELIGARLGLAYAAIEPAYLPDAYQPALAAFHRAEPVCVAYRSALDHLSQYATPTQRSRLGRELAIMFLAYNAEATWRRTKRAPAVFEYLTHRWENSFLPPMVLVDPVAGYELPAYEFADGRVRRVFATAGLASVILNDLYSMSAESDEDFSLPKLIAAEEGVSLHEAVRRSVQVHNELMYRYEAEATLLAALGSPLLTRFLADVWAWLGGNREWHATTSRYRR